MNIRKVVVAVNETPAAVHALREAAAIAGAAGAELIALTVVQDPWQHVERVEVEGFQRLHGTAPAELAERRAAAALEDVVAATIGPGRARIVVQFGLPTVELARWCDLAKADLLVLGRQPLGDLARRPAGRTVAGTLARARMPCLLVPFGQRSWRRVVAAVGSGPAAVAVRDAATAFAALWNAVPVSVHAEPWPAGALAPPSARAEGGAATLTAAEAVVHGDPVGEVLKAAREHQADTLVFGYHRGETAAEVGRVAPHLLERAPCATLTVPL